MGPKQSTPEQTSKRQLKINHPIFSLAQQIPGAEEQTYIKTQLRLANKQQFDEWYNRINTIPQNDSLMQPLNAQYQTQGLCGNSGVAYITYNDYPYLLSDEIQNRKSMQIKLFQESQLWYLVYTILSAASAYHQKGQKTGDIRPDNIFINQNGQVKVASVDSWPGEQTNYSKSFFQKQITYLSPEQVKDYQFGKIEQSSDKQLAQTFSIGLSALDAATLSDSKSLYSKNLKFNYESLQNKLCELEKQGYSEIMIMTIRSMCEVDAEYRLKARQIVDWLRPYEDSILNLEDFEVEGIPQKLKILQQRNQKIKPTSTLQQASSTQYSYPLSTYNPVQTPNTYAPMQLPTTFVPSQLPPTFTQPVNLPINTSYIPSYAPNIQIPSYQVTSTYNKGYEVSPTYNPSQSFDISSKYQGLNQPLNSANGFQNNNVDIHKFTLSKIDEQLQMSRKMFPQ